LLRHVLCTNELPNLLEKITSSLSLKQRKESQISDGLNSRKPAKKMPPLYTASHSNARRNRSYLCNHQNLLFASSSHKRNLESIACIYNSLEFRSETAYYRHHRYSPKLQILFSGKFKSKSFSGNSFQRPHDWLQRCRTNLIRNSVAQNRKGKKKKRDAQILSTFQFANELEEFEGKQFKILFFKSEEI
jgi:hypothetical protein